VAKKLSDISKSVEAASSNFVSYLKNNITKEVFDIIANLSNETEVYIFSGVIRNFFLKKNDIRDIDLILSSEIDVESTFRGFEIRRNSYGGYKLLGNNTTIDLWYLKSTWALQFQPTLHFEIEKYIPYTAFFNFSSVIFSLNDQKFYATKHFLKFLRDKKIDVVYKPSANYRLCIINTFYYSDKYNLKIADNLKKHILLLAKSVDNDFESPQIKHFGKIIYSSIEIINRISNLKKENDEMILQKHSNF
jgi:hypothetical protein